MEDIGRAYFKALAVVTCLGIVVIGFSLWGLYELFQHISISWY